MAERTSKHSFPKAVPVPEFNPHGDFTGIAIGGTAGMLDVNFCLNTTCGNFGKPWQAARRRRKPYWAFKKPNNLSLKCTECGQGRRLYSNQAVDAMYLHVLNQHLPYNHCKNEECGNYRLNFYERYGKEDGYTMVSLDPANSEYVARCAQCKGRVTVGVPWGRHKASDKDDLQFFMKLVCNNNNPSNVMEILDYGETKYYSMLSNLARACEFQSGRHLMALQGKDFTGSEHYEKNGGCMRLYSDIMDITVVLSGEDNRTTTLHYLVTTTDYQGSYFVLAATPMFMLADINKGKLSQRELDWEAGLLECEQPHAHLLWGGTHIDSQKSAAEFPVAFLDGYFVRRGYGSMAHFLVLRKMLSRIGRIIHYIDNEQVLRIGALTAFADNIRTGKCEVVAVKIRQSMKPDEIRKHNIETAKRMLEEQASGRERARHKKGEDLGSDAWQRYRLSAMTAAVNGVGERVTEALTKLEQAREAAGEKAKQRWRHADDLAFVFGTGLSLRNPAVKSSRAAQADDDVEEDEEAGNGDEAGEAGAGNPDNADSQAAGENEPAPDTKDGEGTGENKADEDKKDKIVLDPLNLWVYDPRSPSFEPLRSFLWQSRRKEKGIETGKRPSRAIKNEVDLYMKGKHQPVDTYMAALRQVASVAERAHLVASVRFSAGYISNSRRLKPIVAELALQRFYWNFMRRRRTSEGDRYVPRASKLGLSVRRALTVDDAGTYRHKVFDWAKEITKWLGT